MIQTATFPRVALVKGWLVECCFTSTETVGLFGTGAQDGHLHFRTALELRQSVRSLILNVLGGRMTY